MKTRLVFILLSFSLMSCVSAKKYAAVEAQLDKFHEIHENELETYRALLRAESAKTSKAMESIKALQEMVEKLEKELARALPKEYGSDCC